MPIDDKNGDSMYLPSQHQVLETPTLHALIASRPLGTWVALGDDGLLANHLPMLLDPARGELGTLMAHVARGNPVWRSLSPALPSIVIFHGPDAYITPSWYPSKHAHGKAVPTWNYAVVHAHGIPRVIEDRDWLLRHLGQLTDSHEVTETSPWTLADAPQGFIARMVDAIVGIEIPITKLVGKWKVSQNRTDADKRGVVEGLLARGDAASGDIAELVSAHFEPR